MIDKAEFKRHLYSVSQTLETVIHYEQLQENSNNLLTEKIKFSKDRGFSQASGILYWLHFREKTKWGRQLTGLRPYKENIFYGDIIINGTKSLLIFQFKKEKDKLIIDVFRGFYPLRKGILTKILKTHPYHFKIKKGGLFNSLLICSNDRKCGNTALLQRY